MNVFNIKNKNIFLSIIIIALYFFGAQKVFALDTDGTIPTNSYAWGENFSWINFGLLAGNIHVTNTAVTGYAWSQNYGWINLSPTNGGVTNNTSGTLGGNAWAAGLGGWIPFDSVTINSSGKFTGTAGIIGTDAGRINFDCTNCNVVTDWRPSTTPTSSPSSSSTTTTNSTSTGGVTAPVIAPTSVPGQIRFLNQTIPIPTEITPSQLFDVAIQPLVQSAVKNNYLSIGVVVFILLLILLYIIYRVNRKISHRKIEQIKKIKKLT